MPKVVNHEEQRAGFVTASWEVIAEEGLGAATLRRVAAAAGMTTGALTHYFSDREALLVEALRAWCVQGRCGPISQHLQLVAAIVQIIC